MNVRIVYHLEAAICYATASDKLGGPYNGMRFISETAAGNTWAEAKEKAIQKYLIKVQESLPPPEEVEIDL